MVLCKILLTRINKMIRSKFLGILLLIRRMTDCSYFRTHCLSKHKCKMPKTSNSYNCNFLAWATAMSFHGRVDGQASAEHGCRQVTWDGIRDGEDKLFVGTDVTCVSSPCFI